MKHSVEAKALTKNENSADIAFLLLPALTYLPDSRNKMSHCRTCTIILRSFGFEIFCLKQSFKSPIEYRTENSYYFSRRIEQDPEHHLLYVQ